MQAPTLNRCQQSFEENYFIRNVGFNFSSRNLLEDYFRIIRCLTSLKANLDDLTQRILNEYLYKLKSCEVMRRLFSNLIQHISNNFVVNVGNIS